MLGQAAAEIFKVRPVVTVEAVANLRAHVCEKKGFVHSWLGPFGVCCGYLVPAVVSGTEVVTEFGAEFLGD